MIKSQTPEADALEAKGYRIGKDGKASKDFSKSQTARAQIAPDERTARGTRKTTPDSPQSPKTPFRSKTEARFAERLTHAGSTWLFEPITLVVSRVGNRKLTYTPDFWVEEDDRITLIEVKGGFIRKVGVLKFDMAIQQYGHKFDFEMWQWNKNKSGQWECIRKDSKRF